jgi:hypothetical protein
MTKYIRFLLFLTISTLEVYSQDYHEIVNYHDSIVGKQNSFLFNGKIYTNLYRVKTNKNQYYGENIEYINGSLTTEGLCFNNLELKYDLFSQELIIKPFYKSTYVGVIIDKAKLDNFTLLGKKFVNIKNYSSDINGYYEIITDTKKIKFFIKHKKKQFEKLDEARPFYEFENYYNHVCFFQNHYSIIKNKKDFFKIFPGFKKEINKFYLENKFLFKENRYEFIKKISKFIDIELSKQ